MYIEVVLRLAKLDALNGRQESAMNGFNFCMTTLENKISVLDIYAEECSDRLLFLFCLYSVCWVSTLME